MPHVQFAFRARSDLHGISEFIAKDSPVNAVRFIAKIEKQCGLLASRPFIGRPRAELGPELRSILVGKYVIFFRPIAGGVEILRVIHSARDLRRALNEPEAPAPAETGTQAG